MDRLIKFALIVLLVGMALLTVLLNTGWLEGQLPEARAAVLFIERLASGDINAAKDMAAGEVLGRLSGRHQIPPPVRVVDWRIRTVARGDGWAELSLMVETEDGGGTLDVQWYHLGLTQEDRQWKVYRMENVTPDLGSGPRRGVSRDDLQAARQVFQDYLEHLTANRYAEAGKLLVGPARKSHEAAAPILSGAPVVKDVGEIDLKPLWKRGKFLVTQIGYQVDGRHARVIVLFYNTRKGWRIPEISQY